MIPRTVRSRARGLKGEGKGRISLHQHSAAKQAIERGGLRTDLDGNERDDDLLEAFGVPARDRLLEQLQHVLQDLHARVEQVDALRDLEVAPRRVVERL